MAEQSHFRGYNSIKEVMASLEPLEDWMTKFKPSEKTITLKRPDFDLLKRWPKAAGMFNVTTTPDGLLQHKGFLLKHDKKAPRYEKRGEA